MFKQIIKTLCAEHKNMLVLIELIIASLVMCMTVDKILGLYVEGHRDQGFNPDRLYVMDICQLPENAAAWSKERSGDTLQYEDLQHIMDMLKGMDDIGSATICTDMIPNSPSMSGAGLYCDTTCLMAMKVDYYPGTNFFSTFQFRTPEGKRASYLDDIEADGKGVAIMTSDVEKIFRIAGVRYDVKKLGTDPDAGKKFDKIYLLAQVQMRQIQQPSPVLFCADDPIQDFPSKIVFRVKDNVSLSHFEDDFMQWQNKKLKSGNLYLTNLTTMKGMSKAMLDEFGITSQSRLYIIFAFFIIINTFLIVFGIFWLNVGNRKDEIGIRKTFGGTPSQIARQFMLEGVMIAFVAVAVGALIFMQLHIGKSFAYTGGMGIIDKSLWENKFGLRWGADSMIVLAIILITVVFATFIPAYKASRAQITESLKDE